MDAVETSGLLIWINQFDPFVQLNDAAVDIWSYSMAPITHAEAEEAVTQHYRANPGVKAEPGAILKRALQIRSSRQAGQRAIESTPRPAKTHADYRRKIRETPEFMALFEAGRREGNELRAAATRAREGNQEQHDDWMAA